MAQLFEILKVIILGMVEGITEWLPISSTGHMILVDEFIKLNVTDEFKEMFLVVIQLGAIIAVVIQFWNKLWPFGKDGSQIVIKKPVFEMWFHVIVSCLPAIIIGLPFDDFFNKYFYNYVVVALALIVFGIAFIYVENRNKGVRPRITSIRQIDYKTALFIGLFQLIAAVFPGTSRSGATIVGALLLGVSRKTAAEYTFYLAVPVMFGASLLKLVKYGFHYTAAEFFYLILGMAVAFAVSWVVIKFLMSYIKKHDFKFFGWYRIVLGTVVLIYFIVTKIGAK
ncbi:MAG: undecaprenyl-diphosphate phosphatase [Ruminococcaceae bacterium]|nr:undecaprenyl-diphosphate phosphatase [Oscillospiraceae bacterium]